MNAWIKTGFHAGHKQLRNSAIAATILVRRGPALLHRPLCTARSTGRQ